MSFVLSASPNPTTSLILSLILDMQNNLNQRCLGCIYCKETDIFTDVNKRADSCDVRYAKSLLCELRLAFVTLSAVSLLTCNYEYRRAEPPELIACNAGIIDFKESILKIVEECSKPIGSSDLLAMSPELFDILLKMLHPDDVIFFGSGDSAGNYCPVMHESVWVTLHSPEKMLTSYAYAQKMRQKNCMHI